MYIHGNYVQLNKHLVFPIKSHHHNSFEIMIPIIIFFLSFTFYPSIKTSFVNTCRPKLYQIHTTDGHACYANSNPLLPAKPIVYMVTMETNKCRFVSKDIEIGLLNQTCVAL